MSKRSTDSKSQMEAEARRPVFREDLGQLAPEGAVCIELGVAEGEFAEKFLLKNKQIGHLFGVDRYGDERGHNTDEYVAALRRLTPFLSKHSLLRMSFAEALDLFPDAFFDLIYVDGYAHTGQEDGKTLQDWYPKLKPGGIFSGDDYHSKWPKVVEVVDAFAAEKSVKVSTTSKTIQQSRWSRFPSWYFRKPGKKALKALSTRNLSDNTISTTNARENSFNLSDLAWLFTCDNRNRGVIRLNIDEAFLLWKTAASATGDILEINRGAGGATTLLAAAAGPGRKIISIDPALDLDPKVERFLQTQSPNIASVELSSDSLKTSISESQFGLVFVTNIRSRESLSSLLMSAEMRQIAGDGKAPIIALHNAAVNPGRDYEGGQNYFVGVVRLVEELVQERRYELIEQAGSLTMLVKNASDLP
ncbi:MAG: class I SAM-dependent methyltransferase [Alphaproteobacteria bacterium]|nr:class I SAM-dependent methyltransferase [Alphaproteobacteria bacterium]